MSSHRLKLPPRGTDLVRRLFIFYFNSTASPFWLAVVDGLFSAEMVTVDEIIILASNSTPKYYVERVWVVSKTHTCMTRGSGPARLTAALVRRHALSSVVTVTITHHYNTQYNTQFITTHTLTNPPYSHTAGNSSWSASSALNMLSMSLSSCADDNSLLQRYSGKKWKAERERERERTPLWKTRWAKLIKEVSVQLAYSFDLN